MTKLIRIMGICGLVFLTTYFDCGSSYPPATAGGGFYIETQSNGAFQSTVYVSGSWKDDLSGAQGSVFSFPSYPPTDVVGNLFIANGRAPAGWTFTESSGPCLGQSVTSPVALQGVTNLNCITTGGLGFAQFAIIPSTLNSSYPPATVSITGSGFTTTYGMPRVEYYYNDGTFVGAMTATAASSTTISAPTPSGLSNDPTGVYVGQIQNATAGGGWKIIGTAALNLVTPTPPNIGGGGAAGGGGHCGHVCEIPTGGR